MFNDVYNLRPSSFYIKNKIYIFRPHSPIIVGFISDGNTYGHVETVYDK